MTHDIGEDLLSSVSILHDDFEMGLYEEVLITLKTTRGKLEKVLREEVTQFDVFHSCERTMTVLLHHSSRKDR